jgi:transcriptional regulator with XRE-family HTH domain
VNRQPDPDDAAIGARLRQARAEARVTQAEAAAALGIPRSAVSELEAGIRRLAAVELARCATLYLRPPTWFLDGEPETGEPAEAVARLVAGLPPADQETVARFAEFLAARQAARPREMTR